MEKRKYVIGVDYGTDSCRVLIVDGFDGQEIASAVSFYPRWKQGLYCDARSQRYRQHPLDYLETLEDAVRKAVASVPEDQSWEISALAFDTTGSTPVLTDREGVPLSLTPAFAEEPDAMFVLWKDHTAIRRQNRSMRWQKPAEQTILVIPVVFILPNGSGPRCCIFEDESKVARNAYAWIEHCDWMGALLTGRLQPELVLRGRCAAGHKGLWHSSWGGWPPASFFDALLPGAGRYVERMASDTHTAEEIVGGLCPEWADRLGLPEGIPVAVGAIDAHMGAVGAGIRPGVLTRIMGTSTCDIAVCPVEEIGDRPIRGICGQVNGSVLPVFVGLEAGQSAFGDVYAWFCDLLMWPIRELSLGNEELVSVIISRLSEQAGTIHPEESSLMALDWLNGRRTPDANQLLQGAITGLTLGTSAPMIFRALIEATAFGSRAIVDRFIREGVNIQSILAVGGVAVNPRSSCKFSAMCWECRSGL